MNFDPTDADAIKKLARDNCKELIDCTLPRNGNKPGTLGVEKYLSNEYLDSLDIETREKFLSIYSAEEKQYYQERSVLDKHKHSKEFEEYQAYSDKLDARIIRLKKFTTILEKILNTLPYLIPLIVFVATIVHYL